MAKIDLDAILKEWEEDAHFEFDRLEDATLKSHVLVGKYLTVYSTIKFEIKQLENIKDSMYHDKIQWYNGTLDAKKQSSYGWRPDPFDGVVVIKGDYPRYIAADPDMQKVGNELNYHQTALEVVQEILNALKWRHTNFKNIIEWRKLKMG